MGFASKSVENLRKIGRKYVLPVNEIQQILANEIDFENINSVIDFGAGTLFWSEYFASRGGGSTKHYCH